jgi:hypothetical protein
MKKTMLLGHALTRKAQSFIKGGDEMLEPADGGGGTCCWHANFESGDSIWRCRLSRSEAIAGANNWAASSGERSWWCCASCSRTEDQN